MATTNRELAELLTQAADHLDGNKQKALLRAGREALLWPVEASVCAELTELEGVGPYVASRVREFQGGPPAEAPEPPESRVGFLTRTEVDVLIAGIERPRGDLQSHSTYSDGAGTLAEMALAASERGYKWQNITDHSEGLRIAGGMSPSDVARQHAEIQDVNAVSPVRLLRGIELNLDLEGNGDMDPDLLSKLDVVVGSFHAKLRLTDDQTPRYVAGLRNRSVHILGHPRGRKWNTRNGLNADWDVVFDEAARLDKAVEIDGYPDRQDLAVSLVRRAVEAGCRISLGSDAHAPSQLGFLDYSLAAAVAAGVPRDRIVNYLPVDELLAWTSSLG